MWELDQIFWIYVENNIIAVNIKYWEILVIYGMGFGKVVMLEIFILYIWDVMEMNGI